jgi:hypothetical protein
MTYLSETDRSIPTKKFDRRWQVAKWSFQASRGSKTGLLDISEIDPPVYTQPASDKISRFPGNTEPLTSNYQKGISDQIWAEQGIFWAAHFRYTLKGQFYKIARYGIQLLQENKFRIYHQSGAER